VITSELENALRRTFTWAAADFENAEQAQERLLQRDYHPRTGNRRRASLAAALATAAAAITAAVLTLSSAGTHGGGTSTVRLAAWTVTKQPDGRVTVTIRQMLDPGRLQRQLRAFGVPANVSVYDAKRDGPKGWDYSAGGMVPSCHIDRGLMNSISPNGLMAKVFFGPHPGTGPGQPFTVWISPSAIPAGVGVALRVGVTPGHMLPSASIYLVKASPQCTGTGG
jgi:hypothetical protein